MADKNLHDIKIDELDSPKKTPLKNILTLLALLFIILVISVVITKLILTDDETTNEDNNSKSELVTNIAEEENTTSNTTADTSVIPVIKSSIPDRNLTSATKKSLTAHEPKNMRTYDTPKKNNTSKETTSTPKKKETPVVKKAPPKVKKEYIEKVVTKKEPKPSSSTKSATYLGGQQKAVSNSYYIKVGTYRSSANIVAKIKKNNFNYSLVKVEDDKTLTRVLVGPFFSHNQANAQLAKVKANILSGAYITKAK